MKENFKTVFILFFIAVTSVTFFIGLGNALLPLLVAFGLAYLSFPVVQLLERRNINRNVAVMAVFLFGSLLAFSAIFILAPLLIREARELLLELPQILNASADRLEAHLLQLGLNLDLSIQGLRELILSHASQVSSGLLKSSSGLVKGVFSNLLRAVFFILSLLLIPLFYFHIINNYERILENTYDLVPLKLRRQVTNYLALSNRILSGYIRGQLIVALTLASVYGLAYSLIGLRFGLLIGIYSGFANLIPIIGGLSGLVLAVSISLAFGGDTFLVSAVLITFACVQALEGFFITPKLVGDKVGLNALSTMLALIIGGNLLGIIGMIIAIPCAAIFMHVVKDLKDVYKSLRLFHS